MTLQLVLVEDHQALREGLELLLGRAGIEVAGTAGTTEEGRALVERHDPDVALIDIALGGEESGIDLTAELIDRNPDRRIVLYTGSSEIMDLLAQGLTGEQVAAQLFLSPETIKTHIRNAMNKLEANTRVHAIAIALREGFISSPQ